MVLLWPRRRPGERKKEPCTTQKLSKPSGFYSINGMSPLMLLSGLLVPSWGPLGANLAPQGRLLDPKRVPKWVPKVVQNGVQKRNPKSCLARLEIIPDPAPFFVVSVGLGGTFGRPSRLHPHIFELPLASTSLLFVLGHLQGEKLRTKLLELRKEAFATSLSPGVLLGPLGGVLLGTLLVF